MPFRKGNHFCNWSRLARPCTITTGIRKRTIRANDATSTTSLKIHLLMNDAEKKAQWTSWGSGARSVTHSVGLTPCWMCKATAAPNRDLNETKAAGTSWKFTSVYSKSKRLHKMSSLHWHQMHEMDSVTIECEEGYFPHFQRTDDQSWTQNKWELSYVLCCVLYSSIYMQPYSITIPTSSMNKSAFYWHE